MLYRFICKYFSMLTHVSLKDSESLRNHYTIITAFKIRNIL